MLPTAITAVFLLPSSRAASSAGQLWLLSLLERAPSVIESPYATIRNALAGASTSIPAK